MPHSFQRLVVSDDFMMKSNSSNVHKTFYAFLAVLIFPNYTITILRICYKSYFNDNLYRVTNTNALNHLSFHIHLKIKCTKNTIRVTSFIHKETCSDLDERNITIVIRINTCISLTNNFSSSLKLVRWIT